MSLFRRTVDPSLLRIKLRLAKILAAAERERADEAEAELRQLSELWYGDDEPEVVEPHPKEDDSYIKWLEQENDRLCRWVKDEEDVKPPAGMMDRIWANISRKDLEAQLLDALDEVRKLEDALADAGRAHRLATEKLIDDNVKTLENAVAAAEKRSYAQVASDTDKRIKALEDSLRAKNSTIDSKNATIADLQQTIRGLLAQPVEGLPLLPFGCETPGTTPQLWPKSAWVGPGTDEAGVGLGRS